MLNSVTTGKTVVALKREQAHFRVTPENELNAFSIVTA